MYKRGESYIAVRRRDYVDELWVKSQLRLIGLSEEETNTFVADAKIARAPKKPKKR